MTYVGAAPFFSIYCWLNPLHMENSRQSSRLMIVAVDSLVPTMHLFNLQ